jgi:thiamine-monophosphate kinase
MDEFALIRRYFAGQNPDPSVRVGIGDDGAVLRPAPGRELLVVVDTLVESVHFPRGLDPADAGYRAVAVNLSDIAAMGGRPRWMTLALTLVAADERWLEKFSSGLRAAAAEFDVVLVGGDTTRGSQTVITVQVVGDVEPGGALLRINAGPGDLLFVSGNVGDAAAGLQLIQSGSAESPAARRLVKRFCRPSARIDLGVALGRLASAAIDVSDGLLGDLKKLLAASGCGARIDLRRLPLSDDLRELFDEQAARRFALSGGDDYELCFTAPATRKRAVLDAAEAAGVPVSCIGQLEAGDQLVCTDAGNVVEYDADGYTHF